MKYEVMAGPLWGPVIAHRQKTSAEDSGLALAILRLLHSNGCGAPVETAFDFAAWLQRHGTAGLYWRNAFQQLFAGMDMRGMYSSVSLLERRMQENPFQAVRLFLLPTVQRVFSMTGTCILFSHTDRAGDHAQGDYQKYTDEFQATLATLLPEDNRDPLKKTNDDSTVAWRRALAMRLVQYALQPATSEDPSEHALPDILATELFLGAARQQYVSNPDRAIPQLAQEGTVRRSSRHQRDGITGIRHASPGEDPSSMLQHQMVNAFEVLVEQIENEGFTAYDRPPPLPEKRRFIFAALGADIADSRALSLVRAAWWLASQRVELMLCDQEAKIDFAWLQSANGISGRGNFVRSPEKYERIRPNDTSAHFLARCPGLGSPFLSGSAGLSDITSRKKPTWPRSVVKFLKEKGIDVADRGETRVAVMLLLVQDVRGDSKNSDSHLKAWRNEIAGYGAENPLILSITVDSTQNEQTVALEGEPPISIGPDFETAAQQTLAVASQLIDQMMKVVRDE